MTWLFILLAMAVIALAAGVVTGRIAGSMDLPATSLPFRGLPPDDDVHPDDLEDLRFDAALRGYRMDEVDAVIDRLALELRRRDDEIAELRAALAGPPADLDTVDDVDDDVDDASRVPAPGEEREVPAGAEERVSPASDQG